LVAFPLLGSPALAQGVPNASSETAEPAPAAEADSRGVGEILVTAQRREQSLQNVPIAVTALSAEAVAKANLVNAQQLDVVTPGLVTTTVQGASQPYIRGVGSQSTTAGTESTVAQYVNGVYIASSTGAVFRLNSVERIEVLRGPQGTLFGRNATGGVIQVITRKPQYEPTLDVSASYGNYNTFEGSAYGSFGLSDNLAVSLAIGGQRQGKGFGRSLATGDKANYTNDLTGRFEALFDASESTSIRLSADFDDLDSDLGLGRNAIPGTRTITGGPPAATGFDTNTSIPTFGSFKQWGLSQELNSDLGFATLKSITAYRRYHFDQSYDQDTTPVRQTDVNVGKREQTFQQEVLLNGDLGRLNWTVGTFLFDYKARSIITTLSVSTPSGNQSRDATQDTFSYAFYGQGTYALTDSLSITAGLRYTHDKSDFEGQVYAQPGNASPAGTILDAVNGRKIANSKITYRLGADFRPTDNVLLYASVNRGYKSGQFNVASIRQLPTDPETLDSYEVGVKADWFDRILRTNLSAFHYDYSGLQLSLVAPQPIGIQTLNASGAKIDGLEAEVVLAPPIPTGRLRLGANLSLLDAKYTDFTNAPIAIPRPYTSLPAGVTAGGLATCPASSAAAGGASTCVFDASGNQMIRSPKWTMGVNADYSVPIGSGEFNISANYYHNDGFYWEPSNRVRQRAYDVLNGQIAYEFSDIGLRVRVFGRNLTNSRYYTTLTEQSLGDLGALAAPRTYGVGVDYHF
jgi:iron complex outermembrane receptor protein